MSAWGNNISNDFDNRRTMSYTAAAGASGGVNRSLDSLNFNEQFPSLESVTSQSQSQSQLQTQAQSNSNLNLNLNLSQLTSEQIQQPSILKFNSATTSSLFPGVDSNNNDTDDNSNNNSTKEQAQSLLNTIKANNINTNILPSLASSLPPGLTVPENGFNNIQENKDLTNDIVNGDTDIYSDNNNNNNIHTDGQNYQANDENKSEMDKFGLNGLLPLLRVEQTDQTTIAKGIDLNMLGLDLLHDSKTHKLSKTFASPWLETSRSEVEPLFENPISFNIPTDDLLSAENRIGTFIDQTLFFIFYSKPRDILQELVARELNKRNWRYHKDLQVWLTKDSNNEPIPTGLGAEQGTYIFFDPTSWEYVTKGFTLYYNSII